MDEKILEIKKLNKSYGEKFSIEDLNLTIKKGEIVGIIGANGAGKSTMIKSILNIINIDSGMVLFSGKEMKSNEEEIKRKIGYVGDNNKFYNDITLKSIYKFVKESYKQNWNDEYFNILINDIFKLDMKKKVKELSKGMLVKYMIALALSHNPELLILDEPTSGLDPIIREEVIKILFNINKEKNVTILMSSHILEDIESICNRIIYIDSGEVILDICKEDAANTYKRIKQYKLDDSEKKLFDEFAVINNENYLFDINLFNKEVINKSKFQPMFERASLSEILIVLKERKNI
ncbi:MAG: ABC transporter ATP-binding protein [Romboutsia sp.]|nr:ABC transporter ATP-binding protein [Romboutsia sp.]